MKIPALNILKNIKFPTLIIVALVLNIAIFILIQRLVSQEHGFDINLIDRNFLDFTRVIEKPIPPPEKIEIYYRKSSISKKSKIIIGNP